MYSVIHSVICVYVLIHLIIRAVQVRTLKSDDRRIFLLFWLWPLTFWLQRSLVPYWQTNMNVADAASLALVLGGICDLGFYFVLKSQQGGRRQMLAFGLPAVVVATGWYLSLGGTGQACVLPHTGRYLVWRDAVLFPDTFYFMRMDRGQVYHSDSSRDPNYGRAIFAPFAGSVVRVDGDRVQLQGAQALVEIGPFLPETIRVKAGDAVFVDQPLGLSGRREGQPPGVRLHRVTGDPLYFRDFFGGRWLGFRYRAAQPKRNWLVTSDSQTRFRVDAKADGQP